MNLKQYILVSVLAFSLTVTGAITIFVAQAKQWPWIIQIIGLLLAGAGVIISWMNRNLTKKQ